MAQWSDIEAKVGQQRSLEERLRDHPELRAKVESLLAVVENAAGDVEKAAEAERRVTEELRQMGHEALQAWARGQAERKEQEVAHQSGVQRKEKKTSIGRRDTAKSKSSSRFSGKGRRGRRSGRSRIRRRWCVAAVRSRYSGRSSILGRIRPRRECRRS